MTEKKYRMPMPVSILLAYTFFVLLIIILLQKFHLVFAPIFFAAIAAYLFSPLVNHIEKKTHIRRWLVTLFLILLLTAIAITIIIFLLPYVVEQSRQAANRIPQFINDFKSRLQIFNNYLRKTFPDLVGRINLMKDMENTLHGFFTNFSGLISTFFSNLYQTLVTLVFMVLLPLFSYYFIRDSARIKSFLLNLIPPRHRPFAQEKAREMNKSLAAFIRGQALVVLILMVLYSSGLLILSVPFALIIGILAGLGDIIPYFGTVIGLILSELVTFVQFQSLNKMLLVAVLFALVKGTENWFFYPKIVGREIGLHFIWVLSALIIFGQLFGFWGLLVALPATTIFKVLIHDVIRHYQTTRFYKGE